MATRFRDRHDAGRRLAVELHYYANRPDVIVLAPPRGGVPVGFEVATALGAPLDMFVVRKLGLPWEEEEVAMGAIASGGVRVLDSDLIRAARVSEAEVDRVTASERAPMQRMRMPPARPDSWEDLLHQAVTGDALLLFDGTENGGIPGLERPALHMPVTVDAEVPETYPTRM